MEERWRKLHTGGKLTRMERKREKEREKERILTSTATSQSVPSKSLILTKTLFPFFNGGEDMPPPPPPIYCI